MDLTDEQMETHLLLHGWQPILDRSDTWFGVCRGTSLIYKYKHQYLRLATIEVGMEEYKRCPWSAIPVDTQAELISYIERSNLWT